MSVDEQGDTSRRMATSRRGTKQFADFARIHAINGKLITREDEMRILKEGVTRFGMELEEARGILLRSASLATTPTMFGSRCMSRTGPCEAWLAGAAIWSAISTRSSPPTRAKV